MNKQITDLLNILQNLSLLDLSLTIKEIEKIFNINSSNLKIASLLYPSMESEKISSLEIIEEKLLFNLILSEVPTDKKIAILKIVRNVTGFGLKESKEIVDTVPKLLKEGITKEEVEKIQKEIEILGGKVIIE